MYTHPEWMNKETVKHLEFVCTDLDLVVYITAVFDSDEVRYYFGSENVSYDFKKMIGDSGQRELNRVEGEV